jgi:serine/threonine-protein kinase
LTSGAVRRGRRLLPASDGLSATTSPSDTTLPPDLEQAAVRRLGHVCLVTATSSAALGFVPPLLDSHAPLHVLSTLPGVIVSLLAYAAVASGRIPVRRLLALGLVYEVVLGFFVAVGFHSAATAPAGGSPGWTPVAVWLMVFPLMIPATTGRTVVATLATAAMDPLGLWVSRAAHVSWSDLGTTFLPTLLAAVIAPIAARIVYGLTVEVGRARRLGSYRLVEKLGQGGWAKSGAGATACWRARRRSS